MPRIRCHYVDCVFLDDGLCTAGVIEVDPELGCMTYSRANDADHGEEDWDEEEELEEWEEEVEDEEEDIWMDEDEY